MTHPLRIAVVGHTNTGKTSLLRALARDRGFGEVGDAPGVTRHVEGVDLAVDGRTLISLYDTPGVEDAIALLAYLDRLDVRPLDGIAERPDGPARITRFLDTPEAKGRFEQEAKVLRQLLASDAGFYVIDARDPVLAKHRDELLILGACGRPLLPVLNFVADPDSQSDTWRDTLSRLGLHAVVEFDAVAPARGGERRLYSRLASLLDDAAEARIDQWLDDVAVRRKTQRQAAARVIADLLIDVAAMRVRVPGDPARQAEDVAAMHARVRAREQAAVDALLAGHGFSASDYARIDLPLTDGRWDSDLFHPQVLREVGVRTVTGVAAGAGVGAAIDLMLGGLSLGAATVAGAAAGGAWHGLERVGERAIARLRGYRELTVADEVLRVLALRQCALVRALAGRSHAAQQPLMLPPEAGDAWRSGRLPEAIAQARGRSDWTGKPGGSSDAGRERAVAALAQALLAGPLGEDYDRSERQVADEAEGDR